MESRKLEIVLHSAKDLDDVKFFGTMSPYATFWIAGGGVVSEICKTNVAKKAGSYPVWDYSMVFELDPTKNDYVLFCEIQHDGTLFDRMIGEVQVPFTELLRGDGSRNKATYPVKIPYSEELKGEIIISHKFSKPVVVSGTTAGEVSSAGGSSTSKGSSLTGSKKKKDGSMRSSSNKAASRKGNKGKVSRPKEMVERRKKDGLMKQIVKNVGVRVGTEAVLLAGTVGAIVASEFLFDENEEQDDDDDEDDEEDEDEYEDEDEEEYEDEDGNEDEDEDEDEDEYGDEDGDEDEDVDQDEDDYDDYDY